MGREKEEELLLNGYRVCIGDNEKVLGNRGDEYTGL